MPNVSLQTLQQQTVHIQTQVQVQVQEYENKKNKYTRVIDESTLRICFPSIRNAALPCPSTENTPFAASTDQDRATSTRGPPVLSSIPSLSLPTNDI
jgi:hypothetical protein